MRWGVVGAVVLGVVAGCVVFWVVGREEAPMPGSGLRLGDLETALLTEDDVSAEGFSDTISYPRDPSDGWEGLSAACSEVAGLRGANVGDEPGELRANFGRDDAGVSHALTLVGEEDLSLSELGDAMQSCGAISEEGSTFALRFDAEPLEDLGEEALAARVEINDSSVRTEGYVVISRRGRVMSSVFITMAIDPATNAGVQLDEEVVQRMAEDADAKLRPLLDD